jgi:uncharacterized membrane protein YphA (DoxX/SURF4 family)
MPSRRLLRAFVCLWWTLGIVLFLGSVQTVRWALHSSYPPNFHLLLLAGVEALGAVLFLIPRTLLFGGILLLLCLGVALLFHAVSYEYRGDLLVYAAGVLFVVVHGSLSPSQWAEARSRSW